MWVRALVQGHWAGAGEYLRPASKDSCWGQGLASSLAAGSLVGCAGTARQPLLGIWNAECARSISTGETCCWSIKWTEQGIGQDARGCERGGVAGPAGLSPLQAVRKKPSLAQGVRAPKQEGHAYKDGRTSQRQQIRAPPRLPVTLSPSLPPRLEYSGKRGMQLLLFVHILIMITIHKIHRKHTSEGEGAAETGLSTVPPPLAPLPLYSLSKPTFPKA